MEEGEVARGLGGWPSFRDEYEEGLSEERFSLLLETLCAATNREDLQGDEPRRLLRSFSFLFFFFFSDDHFPRELSYPPFLWHIDRVFSNTSIGKTRDLDTFFFYVTLERERRKFLRSPFSSIATRFVNPH